MLLSPLIKPLKQMWMREKGRGMNWGREFSFEKLHDEVSVLYANLRLRSSTKMTRCQSDRQRNRSIHLFNKRMTNQMTTPKPNTAAISIPTTKIFILSPVKLLDRYYWMR
jgi:hypothetical protein